MKQTNQNKGHSNPGLVLALNSTEGEEN